MESSGLVSPNWVTFGFTLLNLAVLFFLLRIILFKPVTKFMEARTKKIQDSLEQAENDKARAKELLDQYESSMKQARSEAGEILRQARETAAAEADRIIAQGRAQADRLLTTAHSQIRAEREAAMAGFRREAAGLVVDAAAKLLGREVNREDSRPYAELLLEETGKG
ncbi:MAG: F0F1 ATP synthase subunit B [Spirochaetales bacterium]|jgi:F-type H+-transporting ATPase subunit b|nr:F0F1 ATP synthase subunit B [Spirochaetales bacterium]